MKNYYWKTYYKRGFHKIEEFLPLPVDKDEEEEYYFKQSEIWSESHGFCPKPKPVKKNHPEY